MSYNSSSGYIVLIPEGYIQLLSRDEIDRRVAEMARQLADDLQDKPVTFVGILDGALFFMTDLIRATALDARIDFLRISSYHGGTSSGDLKLLNGNTWNVAGSHVVIVDDILDTGKTLSFCIEHLYKQGAADVRCVVLLCKDRQQEFVVKEPVIGFTIPDHFVIGYGLDLEGRYRHLREIYYMEKTD